MQYLDIKKIIDVISCNSCNKLVSQTSTLDIGLKYFFLALYIQIIQEIRFSQAGEPSSHGPHYSITPKCDRPSSTPAASVLDAKNRCLVFRSFARLFSWFAAMIDERPLVNMSRRCPTSKPGRELHFPCRHDREGCPDRCHARG